MELLIWAWRTASRISESVSFAIGQFVTGERENTLRSRRDFSGEKIIVGAGSNIQMQLELENCESCYVLAKVGEVMIFIAFLVASFVVAVLSFALANASELSA